MKILTTLFNYPLKPHDYNELHEVFLLSCKKHMPDVEVVTLKLQVPIVRDNKRPGCWVNTVKLREMVKYVETCNDDIILADCDMLCTAPAYDAFKEDFDIAVTFKDKPQGRCPLNGGIIFVKNTPLAHDWLKKLSEVNDQMYSNKSFHDEWMAKYFGMNQAAMGYMIENSGHLAKVVRYSTQKWNNCDYDWVNFNEETVFVHVKGPLREAIFQRVGYSDHAKIMKIWYTYTKDQSFSVKAYEYKDRKSRRPSKNLDARIRDRLRRRR